MAGLEAISTIPLENMDPKVVWDLLQKNFENKTTSLMYFQKMQEFYQAECHEADNVKEFIQTLVKIRYQINTHRKIQHTPESLYPITNRILRGIEKHILKEDLKAVHFENSARALGWKTTRHISGWFIHQITKLLHLDITTKGNFYLRHVGLHPCHNLNMHI